MAEQIAEKGRVAMAIGDRLVMNGDQKGELTVRSAYHHLAAGVIKRTIYQ